MDTIGLSSFIAGALTSLLVSAAVWGSWQWYSRKDAFRPSAPVMEERSVMTIAEQLGLSRDELHGELSQGKSMMDIARERGVQLPLPPRWMRDENRQQFLQGMAERMGISVEELQAELSTGKRLMDIAREYGVPVTLPASPEQNHFSL